MILNMCLNKFKHPYVFIIIVMPFLFQQLLGVDVMNKKIMCIDKERHALLDFKAMILQNTTKCVSSWGSDVDDDCCNWGGVGCNHSTGHVINLYLYGCGLEGEISPSLLNLTSLTHLDLSANSFNGTIPKWIGSLTELEELDLSYNSFTGTIPESIGSLAKLRALDLSDNSFNGNIPNYIGSLSELRKIDLSFNSFSGNIPQEFGNLVNLEFLFLVNPGSCSVENITWLSRLSHLEELIMSGISLANADHWVNAILSLQYLTLLFLNGCDLSQVNHPYSSASHVNSSYSSNIATLHLTNNNLNSSMFPWFYPLTSNTLRGLDLSGNKLDELPKYFGNLCSLKILTFTNNSALISFSDFLKTLSAGCTSDTLNILEASSSQLTGSISDGIQNLSSLKQLYLADNQLNGTISAKIWEMPMLYKLDISANSFTDAIFEKISKSGIMYIDLSSNKISTRLPDLLSTFNDASVLDLSSNNFYGQITNVSSTLNVLNLSKNKFDGGIFFLCKIVDSNLTYLDLSHNSFSGQIPDCLWNLKELNVLNLAHNKLSGRLPASVEYLIHLEVLYLYNNFLFGELPLSLRNCTILAFLDLGANMFSGNVPVWIGENLSSLYVLSLGSNDFFGPIPLQFCHLVNLQVLDLSMNNLNGTIPACVSNLTSMIQEELLSENNIHRYSIRIGSSFELGDYIDHAMVQWQGIRREFTSNLKLLKIIDLSSNNLTGDIPNEVTDLRGLLALNLSKNALHGEIPQKIGQVKQLLTLDLSRNHFSGGIPSSISEMTSLSCLDVSYNNLSGRIPLTTQLQSFEPSRYTGNAGLCGPPVTKSCPGDEESRVPSSSSVGEDNIDELERWFYTGAAIGFAIGFWIVCSILLVNRRGRHTFFHFMNSLENWVYVKVMVFKNNISNGNK